MSRPVVEIACGYELKRAAIVKALADNPDSGHLRLALAYVENRGCRLTAMQVDRLVNGDEAIACAVDDMQRLYETDGVQ